MYLMKDITRDGAKVLRERAKPVTFPLSDEDKQLAHDMRAKREISFASGCWFGSAASWSK